MPQNTTLALPIATWTQLTDADVSAFRLQIIRGGPVQLMATVGAVPPASLAGAITLSDAAILPANLLLAELWPGVAGASRVYAYTGSGGTTVSLSHA